MGRSLAHPFLSRTGENVAGQQVLKYASNSFLLLIPILVWNIAFASALPGGYSPEIFSQGIPTVISTSENVLRVFVFMLPLAMPLSIKARSQKVGLGFYLAGSLLYYLSWVAQIYYPHSAWSSSLPGFTAPAYTTFFWFIGIGLIGSSLFVNVPYRSITYIAISALFVAVHTTHAYLVYLRL
jgi:hypothetical protein